MDLENIAAMRLRNQQLAGTKLRTAKEIVEWMGAMQAQDYAMAKWAIGVRLPKSTDSAIQNALDKGEIIRTHLLRPTWHFVSAADIYWMIDLTAPQIKAASKTRRKQLELTQSVITKSHHVIGKALMGNKYLTREELTTELKKVKIPVSNNRATHLIFEAELEGIVCNGPLKNKKQTYALLNERAPGIKRLPKDEALAKLATKYFSSHSPATLQDFTWWSGLPAVDAKKAMEMIKSDFISERIGSQLYLLTNSFYISKKNKKRICLLPAFDELIISYKDRSASLSFEKHKEAISSNGIFRPSIVVNGQVAGVWGRMIKKDAVILNASFFQAVSKSVKSLIDIEAKKFGYFLEKKTEIFYHST